MSGGPRALAPVIAAPPAWAGARAIVSWAVESRAFPCASIEVGSTVAPLWREAFGMLTFDADAAPASPETIFDLASLTKPVATASIAMRLLDAGSLDLDAPVGAWIAEWRAGDRADATVRDLLAHCSGLPAHLQLYEQHRGRLEFEHAIARTALEYPLRTQSIYSDLGFILLGFLLEDAGRAPLAAQFQEVATLAAPHPLAFNPPRAWRGSTAPTERERWRGRLLVAEVHDLNAWALGGAAGHAGLFGTAAAVGGFARAVLAALRDGDRRLAHPDTVRTFARRVSVPGSTRALGWDTMKSTSSCGTRLSPTAIGHTGFTGTSLWIDWERDFYAVLLTNRVHPDPGNDAILRVRPAFHDALAGEPTRPSVGPDRPAG
jgi:CubicO group peptidase (beta-lactamase class C family)